MKKELPISVILLALGAWCCFQFPSNSEKQNSNGNLIASEADLVANYRGPSGGGLGQTNFIDGSVVQTSWETPTVDSAVTQPAITRDSPSANQAINIQRTNVRQTDVRQTNVRQTDAQQSEVGATAMRAFPPGEFLKVAAAHDLQVTDAILRVANGIRELPAFATHTKINSQLFGVSMAATGKYFQTARGRKSRMEIQCVSPVAKTLLQMSDGRFVYFLKSDHQQQKLEFIDLFRLTNHRSKVPGGLLPTTWVMGGGIGKAISHYAESFDFQKVISSLPSESALGLTKYRGIWKAGVLLHLIHASKPYADRPGKVVWADVPRQLPHAIELTFKAAAGEAAVPKQISFFKFSTDGEISAAKEIVRIEFSPFEFKNTLPDELFTLESTDFEATDITKVYNKQIQKLSEGMDKVANQGEPAADLR